MYRCGPRFLGSTGYPMITIAIWSGIKMRHLCQLETILYYILGNLCWVRVWSGYGSLVTYWHMSSVDPLGDVMGSLLPPQLQCIHTSRECLLWSYRTLAKYQYIYILDLPSHSLYSRR